MAEQLPRRLVGYGAYNLCFDRLLAKKQDNNFAPDFFATIRNHGFNRINLVKVICFRHSGKENHPASRTIPLYITQTTPPPNPSSKIVVNPAFLANLTTLVRRAQETGFWVQVCIFHYQAIEIQKAPPVIPETPELLPAELVPAGASNCARLKAFFNPAPANANQLTKQKELVAAVVGAVKAFPNVIFEIGNELRIDGDGCTPADNCKLAEWMNLMRNEIFRVTGFVQTRHVSTSTGRRNFKANDPAAIANEDEIFKTCANKLVQPDYFDFHFDQWFDRVTKDTLMDDAIARAKSYRDGTPLIINDDGSGKGGTAVEVEAWAREAFSKRLHFATKQPYYNGASGSNLADFDLDVLRRLDTAAAMP